MSGVLCRHSHLIATRRVTEYKLWRTRKKNNCITASQIHTKWAEELNLNARSYHPSGPCWYCLVVIMESRDKRDRQNSPNHKWDKKKTFPTAQGQIVSRSAALRGGWWEFNNACRYIGGSGMEKKWLQLFLMFTGTQKTPRTDTNWFAPPFHRLRAKPTCDVDFITIYIYISLRQ